ncbi:MAG: LPS-assembly lipoprotein LptE [Syntrophales bacterium]
MVTRQPRQGSGRSHRWVVYAAALLMAVLPAGCGYRFAGGESVHPTVRTVFVDVFTNRTSEAHAENIFRTAFINRFVQDGRFRLASSRGEADAVFRGTVQNLITYPLSYKAGNFSAEDRLAVRLELTFEERHSGRLLWSDGAFSGTGDYFVTTAGATETSRRNALVKLADDTAERAYRLIMSGF